jgi:NADP-dependent 3-hydroxy acid dehydrogenase YdfG
VDAAVIHVKEQAGALHILMNIVGSNALERFPKIDIDEWNKLFEINVTGTLRGIQTCAPLIKGIWRRLNRQYRVGCGDHRQL